MVRKGRMISLSLLCIEVLKISNDRMLALIVYAYIVYAYTNLEMEISYYHFQIVTIAVLHK
jgi:hypothetical protein